MAEKYRPSNGAEGDCCTAFRLASEPTPHKIMRCSQTRDMFAPEDPGDDGARLASMIEHGMSGIDWSGWRR